MVTVASLYVYLRRMQVRIQALGQQRKKVSQQVAHLFTQWLGIGEEYGYICRSVYECKLANCPRVLERVPDRVGPEKVIEVAQF